MKRKILGMLLAASMSVSMLVGCGSGKILLLISRQMKMKLLFGLGTKI